MLILCSSDSMVLTSKIGLTTPNILEARVNRAMVEAAEEVVAVCDSSKFNRRSLSLVVGTSAIDHVVTDSSLGAGEVKAIRVSKQRLFRQFESFAGTNEPEREDTSGKH